MSPPFPQPQGFCRDCLAETIADEGRCRTCRSPRLIRHAELYDLTIAHIDCDAFYAAIEKRDNPALADVPLIVGGGTRGVVSTCCYIARIRGVRSAMPMFKALALAPDAVVVKPNMAKYAKAGRQVRELMLAVTPSVQPISIDEAFLDLGGTSKLHGQPPAKTLAKLIRTIETEVGISASVGLAPNKFLAKVASDLQKPKGFSVIGKQEAKTFLADKSVSLIWGVGQAFQQRLAQNGITSIGQLQHMERNDLIARFGSMGNRLYFLSRGEDTRTVHTDDESKSISAETTFNSDITDSKELSTILWTLCEKVGRRAKKDELEGHTITLKLKTKDFKTRSRSQTLIDATQLAHRIFEVANPLLLKEATGTAFRLIGVGLSNMQAATHEDYETLDQKQTSNTKAELAIDKIRARFGSAAVEKGLSFRNKDE